MGKQLVWQTEYGGYTRPNPELTELFRFIENDPNFDVFENGHIRLILGKCSRIADDEDLSSGRYGMDLHRAIPTFGEAQDYARNLPSAIKNRDFTGNISFAAATEDLYRKKVEAYNRFYSCIVGTEPMVVFASPHAGDVQRAADRYVPFPKQEIDAWAGDIAARCAESFDTKPDRRIMVSVHSHFFPGPVIDIGDFGLPGTEKLKTVSSKLESEYHDRLQEDRQQRADDTAAELLPRVEKFFEKYGDDIENSPISQDRFDGRYISKGIELYRVPLEEVSISGFSRALSALGTRDVKAFGYGDMYTGRKVGRLIGLQQMVDDGLLDGAVQIEISRAYGKAVPDLVAQMINDLVREYFFG